MHMNPSYLPYCSFKKIFFTRIVSEYDQEIPQSQSADKPMAPRGGATQLSRDKLSKAAKLECT